jgi:ATP-grasp domain, R2K clade family 3
VGAMKHILYYRNSQFHDELSAAKKHFHCVDLLTDIEENSLVVGRYSLHPFYYDQEREIKNLGSKLINTHNQHLYIAELQNYVDDLKELTPKTWYSLHEIPDEGPFILKGGTNSKKHKWNELMFAKDKKTAIEVHSKLSEDGLIGYQHIYVRQYVPLITYAISIGGLPITKEFRFFVAFGEILCGDYYWSNYRGEFPKPSIDEVPKDFLEKVISRIGDKVNFYALDVAQTQTGEWIVIELNDGQFSGPSENDLNVLYKRLKEVCSKHFPES